MKKFYFNIENEVGLDEAGRGPLFGRVYAAAVNWGDTPINESVMDSKKLSSKKRKEVLEWIQQNVDEWAVGYAEPEEIDSINIISRYFNASYYLLLLKPTAFQLGNS